jgi:hypothetical protein
MPKNPILGFVTYNTENGVVDRDRVAEIVGKSMESYNGFCVAESYPGQTYFHQFKDIVTNLSIRDDFKRSDYEYFRPNERSPQEIHQIIYFCMEAYRRVGVVHNVIDLMADFAVKGIRLLHPNPQVQKFFRGWFKKINGVNRSERFLNLLYRAGNVPVKITRGKINDKYREYLMSLASEEDPEKVVVEPEPSRYVIPIRYDFLNPVNIWVAGAELATFVGKSLYAMKINSKILTKISSPTNDIERELVKMIPKDIYSQLVGQKSKQFLMLDPKSFKIFHYKKDDWQDLGEPLIFCIFSDLILLEKMKLADLSALDGVISQIRVWKLGNIEQGIFPTDAAISKLTDILLSNPGGGAFDLIWGPELSVEILKTDVQQFLGKAKYEPILESIYSGLGVPPTLTGSSGANGTTNNFISLKTLTERLEYGRQILTDFWDSEIREVQKAMGFRFPATVDFDHTVLSDETAEKALYIQLIDRNILSEETFLERFGECDELEVLRRRREKREQEKEMRTLRAGPWATAERDFQLMKVALQRGLVTPQDAGLDVSDDMMKREEDLIKLKAKVSQKPTPQGGVNKQGTGNPQPKPTQNENGRPFNAKDSGQRDRSFKVRTSADVVDFITTVAWAKDAQFTISNIIQKPFLQKYNKTDVRSLTKDEIDEFENFKFAILTQLEPLVEITEQTIANIVTNEMVLRNDFFVLFNKMFAEAKKQTREPTIDEARLLRAATYALLV